MAPLYEDGLGVGNALSCMRHLHNSLSASLVAGPGTAGALIRLFTAPAALIADAVTSVVSALAIWTIRDPEPQPETSQRRGNLIDEARQGLSLIGRNSVLLAIAGVAGGEIAAVVWLLVTPVWSLRELPEVVDD